MLTVGVVDAILLKGTFRSCANVRNISLEEKEILHLFFNFVYKVIQHGGRIVLSFGFSELCNS